MISFIRKYGFYGSLRLAVSWVYTKLFYPQAKIIRLPVDIRNSRNIQIGKGFITGFGCRIEALPVQPTNKKILMIGDNVQVNDYVHIACAESLTIGNNTLIASKVFITDLNHGSYNSINCDHPDSVPALRQLHTKPVHIEDNVWIGESVSILPGAKIGRGSVIGTCSMVNSEIPPYSIAVGIPARVIKQFNFETNQWEKVK